MLNIRLCPIKGSDPQFCTDHSTFLFLILRDHGHVILNVPLFPALSSLLVPYGFSFLLPQISFFFLALSSFEVDTSPLLVLYGSCFSENNKNF